LHKLAVLLTVLIILVAGSVSAQMCPSTTKFIRIVAFDENNKPSHSSALHIAPEIFPGTDAECPNQDILTKMMEIDLKNQTIRPVPIAIEKGAVSDPVNVLTDEEVTLFKEKGIVNPPNIKYNNKPKQQPALTIPKKGQTAANAKADALYSSIN
jgi:hypothetical protein